MKKLLLGGLGTFVVLAVVVGGTAAFFSSQASVNGNAFAAGTLNLALTQAQGGSSPQSEQVALWNFTNMAPGGTPETASVWLRNVGTIPGATLNLEIPDGWTNPNEIASQMRITELMYDGQSLLVGGAGAVIPEYEAPISCDWEVNFGTNDFSTISSAIAGANAGDVICVGPGDYNSGWELADPIVVNQEVTIVSVEGPDTTSSVAFNVTADNVTIKGFEITSPNSSNGVFAADVDNITVTENVIRDIGTALPSGSAHGVYLKPTTQTMAGAVLTFNRVENIGNPNLTVSAKGFYIGDTSPVHGISDVRVENNIVETVRTSRGAYGLLANHGGGTTDLKFKNNTVSDLEGAWEMGISLYNDTPGAEIVGNDFSDIPTGFAVNIENNTSAG